MFDFIPLLYEWPYLLESESEHHLYVLNFSTEAVQSSFGEVHGTPMHNSTLQKRKSSRLYYVSIAEPCVRQKNQTHDAPRTMTVHKMYKAARLLMEIKA